jgi:hypothetical protein
VQRSAAQRSAEACRVVRGKSRHPGRYNSEGERNNATCAQRRRKIEAKTLAHRARHQKPRCRWTG